MLMNAVRVWITAILMPTVPILMMDSTVRVTLATLAMELSVKVKFLGVNS